LNRDDSAHAYAGTFADVPFATRSRVRDLDDLPNRFPAKGGGLLRKHLEADALRSLDRRAAVDVRAKQFENLGAASGVPVVR